MALWLAILAYLLAALAYGKAISTAEELAELRIEMETGKRP